MEGSVPPAAALLLTTRKKKKKTKKTTMPKALQNKRKRSAGVAVRAPVCASAGVHALV